MTPFPSRGVRALASIPGVGLIEQTAGGDQFVLRFLESDVIVPLLQRGKLCTVRRDEETLTRRAGMRGGSRSAAGCVSPSVAPVAGRQFPEPEIGLDLITSAEGACQQERVSQPEEGAAATVERERETCSNDRGSQSARDRLLLLQEVEFVASIEGWANETLDPQAERPAAEGPARTAPRERGGRQISRTNPAKKGGKTSRRSPSNFQTNSGD